MIRMHPADITTTMTMKMGKDVTAETMNITMNTVTTVTVTTK